MSFESPKNVSRSAEVEELSEISGSGRTPIRDKFKSMISKASHRSSATSFSSFGSKRKSFEVLGAKDTTHITKSTHLTVDTNILETPDAKKRESASTSTYSEGSTNLNNLSPIPPGSVMEGDDDYEYYRYYYNYHQQQHQGTTSHIVENFDSSGSSKEPSEESISRLGDRPVKQFRSSIIRDKIYEESPRSKLDIFNTTSLNKIQLDEDEEIERQKNEDENLEKVLPLQDVYNKRKSIPPSTGSFQTFATNESFHSAVSDLDLHSQATNNTQANETTILQETPMTVQQTSPPETKQKDLLNIPKEVQDPRTSVNSRNTLNNIYSSYLNEHEDFSRRGSSIYDSNRASTIGAPSNRNTATPSLLDTVALEIQKNPLPDIRKYGSNSTISLKDKTTLLAHRRSYSQSIASINTEDAKIAVAYASGAMPKRLSGSHSRSRSVSSGGSSFYDQNKRDSKHSEKVVAPGNTTNRSSQGFYFENEEPIMGVSANTTQSSIPQQQLPTSSAVPKRFSNIYSKAQTKFPLLLSSGGITSNKNPNRDTVTTTNTYTSSAYGSNYRSSYQTNVTTPTETGFPKHSSIQQSTQHDRMTSIDDESRFDTYDKKLQELQTDLSIQDEDEDAGKFKGLSQQNEDDDNESIFVPPYLNNTAHTQSSSFSSLKKGQESFKSSKSNNNLAATSAIVAAASELVPNVLNDEKKFFVRPVSYQQFKQAKQQPSTLRSTNNTGVVRPSAYLSSTTSKYQSTEIGNSPTTPFSPLSIQNNKYIKSINDDNSSANQNVRDSSYSKASKHKQSKLRQFNLRPESSLAHSQRENTNITPDFYNNYDTEKYGVTSGSYNICSTQTVTLLLLIGFFVPPLLLVMTFGFMDPTVGYIQRKYKMIAGGLSLFAIILSIVGICVGFGVGVA